jgi:hypothetical protein
MGRLPAWDGSLRRPGWLSARGVPVLVGGQGDRCPGQTLAVLSRRTSRSPDLGCEEPCEVQTYIASRCRDRLIGEEDSCLVTASAAAAAPGTGTNSRRPAQTSGTPLSPINWRAAEVSPGAGHCLCPSRSWIDLYAIKALIRGSGPVGGAGAPSSALPRIACWVEDRAPAWRRGLWRRSLLPFGAQQRSIQGALNDVRSAAGVGEPGAVSASTN